MPQPDAQPFPFALVVPDLARLADYEAALRRGWSPDNLRGAADARDQLAAIARDPGAFLAALNTETPGAARITLPDGSQVPRLPSLTRWIWSDGFAGQISLRWQPGTDALPPTCLGHVGYAVCPERRRRGLATRALGAILPEARRVGLTCLDLTCAPDNHASRRVIERNGGTLAGTFRTPPALGGLEGLHFRLPLDQDPVQPPGARPAPDDPA